VVRITNKCRNYGKHGDGDARFHIEVEISDVNKQERSKLQPLSLIFCNFEKKNWLQGNSLGGFGKRKNLDQQK
jgi:hypothetical protein